MTTRAAERKPRPTTETVLKTLTALFGLLVAVLGFWTSQLSREKQQAESQTVVVQQESSELRQQVAAMREEIEQLKADREASPASPGGTSEAPAAARYRVVLQLGETFDLDTRKKSRVASPDTELSRARFQNELVNPRGYEFFPVSATLDQSTCQGAVERRTDRRYNFRWDELTGGLTFCLPTSETRVAGITVVKRGVTYEGPIELDVRLW